MSDKPTCDHLFPVFGCDACISKNRNGEPLHGIPDWFTPTKTNKTQTLKVRQGLHPMGMRLADNGKQCGDCEHLQRKRFSKTYLKCAKALSTGGPATDIRARWPACELYEPKEDS